MVQGMQARRKALAWVLLLASFALNQRAGAAQFQSPPIRLDDLRTEYLADPIGIDVPTPRLGWKLRSTARDVAQTAFQVQVTTDEGALFDTGVVWDSGRVTSDRSIQIPYEGLPLTSGTRYRWRVRVWTDGEAPTDWSEPAFWEMGLLGPEDWQAAWISPGWEEDPSVSNPAPLLRQQFQTSGRIGSARIYATSRGLYELYLNGTRVGDRLFTPGFTSYNKRLQYQTYDVTELIANGANVLGARLGDGWYRGFMGFSENRNVYGTELGLLAQLVVTYTDGRSQVVATGGDWKAARGSILSSDIYNGETQDLRLRPEGWSDTGYDATAWSEAIVSDATSGRLVADMAPPVRRTEEVPPVSVRRTASGGHIVDLGQNIVGWVRLTALGEVGDTITLRYGEALDADGEIYTQNLRDAKQTDAFTLKGGVDEVLEPHFTFHGFRYVAIEGYPGVLGTDDVTGIVVHSDLEKTGSFETSDEAVNQLQANIVRSQEGNFLDIPTDCPQRDERLGWTGDAQLFGPTACFNMGSAAFFTKWLRDLAADQRPDGAVPWVVPDVLGPRAQAGEAYPAGAAGWGDAAVIVPWTLYVRYGDVRILEEQYPSMRRWVDYATEQAGSNFIWETGFQFGDWLPAGGSSTRNDLIATAFLARSADILSRAAEVVGRGNEARKYRGLFESVRKAFGKQFVTFSGGLREPTQTAYVLALHFGLMPDAMVEGAVRRLADNVRDRGTHLSTGFLGTPYINDVLTDNGHSRLAYSLLLQDSYPSWLYPISQGATTIWESWDGIRDGVFRDPLLNSLNHYARGAVGDWMYRTIGGIRPDPDRPAYKHVWISPIPDDRLRYAKTRLETMYGTLRVDWGKDVAGFTLNTEVPANSSATVRLPGTRVEDVLESESRLEPKPGIHSFRQEGDDVVVEIGSGRYRFAYSLATESISSEQGGQAEPGRFPFTVVVGALLALFLWGTSVATSKRH